MEKNVSQKVELNKSPVQLTFTLQSRASIASLTGAPIRSTCVLAVGVLVTLMRPHFAFINI